MQCVRLAQSASSIASSGPSARSAASDPSTQSILTTLRRELRIEAREADGRARRELAVADAQVRRDAHVRESRRRGRDRFRGQPGAIDDRRSPR